MKEIKLASGAVLKMSPVPFAISKALFKAMLREVKGLALPGTSDLGWVTKDMICIAFSSDEVEACVWECMKYCIYNSGKGDLKIDKDTFESETARGDYIEVCMEVAKENLTPFMKSLYAAFSQITTMIGSIRA